MATILMVDDHEDNLTVIEIVLKHWGHTFIGIQDPGSMLSAIQAHQPDLVILDLQLPRNFDGLALAQQIRAEISETLPLIAITASTLIYNRDQALAAGFNDFLERPLANANLKVALEALLA